MGGGASKNNDPSDDSWKMKSHFLQKQCKVLNNIPIEKTPNLARFTINQKILGRSQIKCEMMVSYPPQQILLINQLNGLKPLNHDYWAIFRQLVEGLYQIHSLNLIGRSLKLESIYVLRDTIIFYNFGYSYSLEFTPENTFRKFSTYESDYWLIAAIMWEIKFKKRVFPQYNVQQYQQTVKTYGWQLNLEAQQGNQLDELLISMLQVYTSQRIPILKVIDKLQMNQSEEMKKFYSNYKLHTLLKQFKNSLIRDGKNQRWPYVKILFYKIDSKIVEYFYKLYIEIQLLIFAFHLSFHYPSPNPSEIIKVDKIIIAKLFLISKQLKQKVHLHKMPQQFRNQAPQIFMEMEYNDFKMQINSQHNIMASLWDEQLTEHDKFQDLQSIQETVESLYYLTGNLTLPQRLLIGILKRSKIDEIPMKKYQCLTLDEIFMIELQSRI